MTISNHFCMNVLQREFMERAKSEIVCGTERARARMDVSRRIAPGPSSVEESVGQNEEARAIVGCD